MTKPSPPSVDEALRLARINLRSRLMSLAGRVRTMDVNTIEVFHDHLDQARDYLHTSARRARREDQ